MIRHVQYTFRFAPLRWNAGARTMSVALEDGTTLLRDCPLQFLYERQWEGDERRAPPSTTQLRLAFKCAGTDERVVIVADADDGRVSAVDIFDNSIPYVHRQLIFDNSITNAKHVADITFGHVVKE